MNQPIPRGAPLVLLDMDNCISDDGWRIGRIRNGHRDPMVKYHDYHMLAPFDAVGNQHLFDMSRYPSGSALVIITARPNHYRAFTEHWLVRHGVAARRVLMRADTDFRPSPEVKRAALRSLLHEEERSVDSVMAAYDDHIENLLMYRREGVRHATLYKLHDICAYTTPLKEQAL